MKNKFLLFCFSLLIMPKIYSLETQKVDAKTKLKTLVTEGIKGVSAHILLGLAHELGHVAAFKLLDATHQRKDINDIFEFGLQKNILCIFYTYWPPFQNSKISALVSAAGPLAGLLTSYATLKFSAFYSELSKGTSVKLAFYNTFHKRLINKELSTVGTVALAHGIANILHLVPIKISRSNQQIPTLSHGYEMLQDFGLVKKITLSDKP